MMCEYPKMREGLVALAARLKVNQWFTADHVIQTHTTKKTFEQHMQPMTFTASSHQSNHSNTGTHQPYNSNLTPKPGFVMEIKWDDCYNCEKPKHFAKDCRSPLKNSNHIKVNVVEAKKEKALSTALQ